jgi:hypothetical protein
MEQSALITMVAVQIFFTVAMVYFLVKVLKGGKKK